MSGYDAAEEHNSCNHNTYGNSKVAKDLLGGGAIARILQDAQPVLDEGAEGGGLLLSPVLKPADLAKAREVVGGHSENSWDSVTSLTHPTTSGRLLVWFILEL